jgi:hypothetical protein
VKEQQLEKKIVVNLDEGSPKSSFDETQQFPNLIQKSMRMHNLMLLPRLLAKHIKGKEPLVDYSQSHVVISFEYLDILKKKHRKGNCKGNQGRQMKGEGRKASQMSSKIGFYINRIA